MYERPVMDYQGPVWGKMALILTIIPWPLRRWYHAEYPEYKFHWTYLKSNQTRFINAWHVFFIPRDRGPGASLWNVVSHWRLWLFFQIRQNSCSFSCGLGSFTSYWKYVNVPSLMCAFSIQQFTGFDTSHRQFSLINEIKDICLLTLSFNVAKCCFFLILKQTRNLEKRLCAVTGEICKTAPTSTH